MAANIALALTITVLAGVHQDPPVLRGTWTATVGQKQTFRGTWSASLQTTARNAARGSWTLLDNANRVVLQGTWSAEKSPKAWSGTWTARIVRGSAGGRASRGRSFAGPWQANIDGAPGTTLAEMFEQTLQDQISGSWRSGRLQGNWWLKGSPH